MHVSKQSTNSNAKKEFICISVGQCLNRVTVEHKKKDKKLRMDKGENLKDKKRGRR